MLRKFISALSDTIKVRFSANDPLKSESLNGTVTPNKMAILCLFVHIIEVTTGLVL